RVAFPVGPGFVFSCALTRCYMATLTAPADSAPAPSRNGTADPGPLHAAHTANFPALLRQLGASLLVTTYQAGKLVVVRDEGDHLNTHYRAFQSPMGLALADGGAKLALGTTLQVWYMNPLRLPHLAAFRLGRPSRMLLTLCRMVWK